jgi:putative ABC transport system permease protein
MSTTPPVSSPKSIPPAAWRLALRQLRRDFRAGELRLLLLAIALAVGALSAVGFFADRLQAGLQRDAAALLGGDLVVASDKPLPPEFITTARTLGMTAATTASFPSMARADEAQGGAARLVAVKAVSEGYPLRGALVVSTDTSTAAPVAPDAPAATRVALREAPRPGEVWVDPAVLDALALRLGQALLLGDARLRITRLIHIEPDRGASFVNFAPRVLLNQADLAATALIQPASRVTWRLALVAPAGGRNTDAGVKAYVAWAQERIERLHLRGVRIETLEQGRPEMRQTLDRAGQFLHLVAVLAALLAAVAMGIAARNFAQRHLDACAMLRVLGLPQRRIAWAYGLEFGAVGVLASLCGVGLGLLVQQVFVLLLGSLLDATLPPPGWAPAGFGLAVGLTLLAAFGLPPILQLAQVPPLRVIRRDLGSPRTGSAAVLLAGVAGFAALLVAAADDLKLGAITVGGFGAAWALFAGTAWLAVQALRRLVPQAGAPRWLLLATRQLAARPGFAVLQVSALALGLLALLLLVLLRTDLIDSWRNATPAETPDRFVINIQPDQAEDFRAVLTQAGVARYDWYPMIRGRLLMVNGREVKPEDYADDRARRLVDREFNLSHAATPPEHNRVVAGRWVAEEADGLSVEEGLAQTLGLKLGDTLGFDVAGTALQARITSLRKVDWASMRVNFFVMLPHAELPGLPATQIAAFRMPAGQGDGQSGLDSELARRFPNLTTVDVSAQLQQIRQVLDQVVAAVEFLFVFTLIAGLLVLFAAVSATREGRAREFALMRAMGASSRLLAQVQRTELLGVGALAGTLAAALSLALAWALARYVFNFDWRPSPWVPLGGAVGGALLALAAGWYSLREVLRRPVSATLRRVTAQ